MMQAFQHQSSNKGSLAVVGTGINVGRQTTAAAKQQIENADIVFAAVANDLALAWLRKHNSNVVNMAELYSEGKSRVLTYREMVDSMTQAVYQGQRVCGVFYGHPGVFAWATHQSIRILKQQGYDAYMEPGISAENCLVADLGLDPGEHGCLAIETTQFLFFKHQLCPHKLVILWQIGLTGDYEFLTQHLPENYRGLTILTEELLKYYPSKHEVILYEASIMAIEPPRIDRIFLEDLPLAKTSAISTLVIPSLGLPPFDQRVLDKFSISQEQLIRNLDGIISLPSKKSRIDQEN